MTTVIYTILTALPVKIDDWLGRPRQAGRPPWLSDAELLTIAEALPSPLICTPSGLPIAWSLATLRSMNATC